MLQFQQAPLQILAEGKAGQRAIRADDTVAGHQQADWIGCVGPANRTRRFWSPNRGSQLTIGPGLAKRDALQFRPHLLLKCGSFRRETHIKTIALAGKEFLDLGTNGRSAMRILHQLVRMKPFAEFSDAAKRGRDHGPTVIECDRKIPGRC